MDTLLKALEDLRGKTNNLELVVMLPHDELERRDAIQAWLNAKNIVLEELTKYANRTEP